MLPIALALPCGKWVAVDRPRQITSVTLIWHKGGCHGVYPLETTDTLSSCAGCAPKSRLKTSECSVALICTAVSEVAVDSPHSGFIFFPRIERLAFGVQSGKAAGLFSRRSLTHTPAFPYQGHRLPWFRVWWLDFSHFQHPRWVIRGNIWRSQGQSALPLFSNPHIYPLFIPPEDLEYQTQASIGCGEHDQKITRRQYATWMPTWFEAHVRGRVWHLCQRGYGYATLKLHGWLHFKEVATFGTSVLSLHEDRFIYIFPG